MTMNKVLFKVCDDALIVANTGAPFTRKGVISICYSHSSEKGQYSPKDNYDCSDEKLVEAIQEEFIRTYQTAPNRSVTDASNETHVGQDYRGRVIWELMQNADDAAKDGIGPDLIGEKGLGFKSVLAITEEPEIHSGPFHFRFSSGETTRVLRENGLETTHQPSFGIPHPRKPHWECERLLNYDDGYATVIRLPFRDGDDDARTEVMNQLHAIGEHNLLLCQGLDIIEVSVDGQKTRVFEIDRQPVSLEPGVDRFSVKTNGQTDLWRRWRWIPEKSENKKHLSAAVFLPDKDKQIAPCDTAHHLHVFFPTQEEIGAKALIHASFDLKMNRERLAKEQPNKCELLDAIEQLVSKILLDVNVSLSVAAEIFANIIDDDKSTEGDSVSQIKRCIFDTIEETEFVPVIGGARVKPRKVKLWKHHIGSVVSATHDAIKRENLLDFNSPDADGVRNMLKKFGAEEIGINQHAELLRHCRHDTMDDCFRALKVAASIMRQNSDEETIKSLQRAPFWWTDQERARALDGGDGKALLNKKLDDWPAWLPVDSISEKFRKQIKQTFSDADENGHAIAKWPLREKHQFRNDAMLPFLEGKVNDEDFWRENCASILRWTMAWSPEKPEQSILVLKENGDNPRDRLAHLVRVPTDKGWMPAVQCYAGKSWDGPVAFDEYFNSVENRGLVSPFKEWPAKAKVQENSVAKWKGILRFLGVSYELKTVAFVITNPPPAISHRVAGYKKQCLEEVRCRHSSASQILDGPFAFIEHFPRSIAGCSPSEIYPMAKRYDTETRIPVKYRYWGSEEATQQCSPFVDFQLREESWLPCKPALLHDKSRVKPRDAYMPDFGLGGLLPKIEQSVDNDDWHGESGIKKILENLGVKSALPNHPEKWHEWMEVLARHEKAVDRDACRWSPKHGDRGDIAKAAYAIFTKYREEFKDGLPQSVPVPFLRQDEKGKFLAFDIASNVFWVNDSHLAEPGVETALLQEEIKMFFLTLKQGKEFRLEELSKILDLHPDFGDIVPEESKKLVAIYQERRDILNLIASCELPDICIRVRREMRLRSQKSEYANIVPDIGFWYDSDKQTLDVSAAADQLEDLAYGLAKIIEKDSGGDFCIMLAKKDREECLETLRKRHGYSEDAIEKLSKPSTPETAEGDVDSGEPQQSKPASNSDEPSTSQNDVKGEANSGNSSGEASPPDVDSHRPAPENGSQGTTNPISGPENDANGERPQPNVQSEVPEIKVVSDYPWAPETGGVRKPCVRDDDSDREHEARGSDGKRGEDALLKWLKDEFGASNVTNKNETHPNHPGYDILVVKNGEEHYYECKSSAAATPPRRVTMTKAQFEKAKCAQNCYWLCVIYDVKEDLVKMLEPCNPVIFENEPVITEYKIDLSRQKVDTKQRD